MEASAPLYNDENNENILNDEPPPNYKSITLLKNIRPNINVDEKIKKIYDNLFTMTFYVCSENDIQNFIQLIDYFKNIKILMIYKDTLNLLTNEIINEDNVYEIYLQICSEIAIFYNSQLIIKKCIQKLGIKQIIQLCFSNFIINKRNICRNCDCIKTNVNCKKYFTCYYVRKDKKGFNKLKVLNNILDEINYINDLEIIDLLLKNNLLSYNNFKKIKDFKNYIPTLQNNFNFTLLKHYYKEFPPIDDNDIQFVKNNDKYLNDSSCIIS